MNRAVLNDQINTTQRTSHTIIGNASNSEARNVLPTYNTIQYKTCNAPYVTKMLSVGAFIHLYMYKDRRQSAR